ncbi:MAG: ABC transporter ATP-binding protein [Micromonosporaceae bacterium]
MTRISLQKVSKVFGNGAVAVDELSLDVEDGELLVLLGQSGCGKSTVLRLIAGLETPTSGTVLLDGHDADEITVQERKVGMIFQDYALYPHMTIRENIGFPLTVDRTERSEIESRVTALAEHLGIDEILDRRPRTLSGGQAQRVAMARALVRRPSIFLLDEPLSNVDTLLRARLRTEISDMVRDAGVTTVYVTHDQIEAMSVADRVAILRHGMLDGIGRPDEIYRLPPSTYVAAFLGSPRMNLVPAYVQAQLDSRVILYLGETARGQTLSLPWSDPRARTLARYHGEALVVGARPDAFHAGTEAGPSLHGVVRYLEHWGNKSIGHLDIGTPQVVVDGAETGVDRQPLYEIAVQFPAYPGLAPGQQVTLGVEPSRLHFFESTGQRIEFRRF